MKKIVVAFIFTIIVVMLALCACSTTEPIIGEWNMVEVDSSEIRFPASTFGGGNLIINENNSGVLEIDNKTKVVHWEYEKENEGVQIYNLDGKKVAVDEDLLVIGLESDIYLYFERIA